VTGKESEIYQPRAIFGSLFG